MPVDEMQVFQGDLTVTPLSWREHTGVTLPCIPFLKPSFLHRLIYLSLSHRNLLHYEQET